jgi:hypothetical protein
MPLSDVQFRDLKVAAKPYRLPDGGNLCIEVKPNGPNLCKLFYQIRVRMKTLSLGAYPNVSLARARAKRQVAKGILADGADPMALTKADNDRQKVLDANTLSSIASQMLAKAERQGLAETKLIKKRWLIRMASADLDDRAITAITAAEILKTLQTVEAKGIYETTDRLRATIGEVFRYANATARADTDPTLGLRGTLVTPRVMHRAAITARRRFEPC